jgi:hypothetical protein
VGVRTKRPLVAVAIGVMLVLTTASGASVKSDDKVKPVIRDPSDPAAVRDAMGEGELVAGRGKMSVGYKCSGTVVLPAGVQATRVCALDGSGKVVGFMTFGDVGFVDRKIGRDREALTTLVRCYDEVLEYSISGSVPFTKECRASLKSQGVDVSRFTRGSPELAQRIAERIACANAAERGESSATCP